MRKIWLLVIIVIFLLPLINAITYVDDGTGFTLPSNVGVTLEYGTKFTPHFNMTFENATKKATSVLVKCRLTNSTRATLVNSTWNGNYCVMQYNLVANTTYYLMYQGSGTFNIDYGGTVQHVGLYFNTSAAWDGGADSQVNPTSILNMSFSYGAAAPPANDTCTYSGTGNWNIKCSDNCNITSAVTVLGNITLDDTTGTLAVQHNLTFGYFFKKVTPNAACKIAIKKGLGGLIKKR